MRGLVVGATCLSILSPTFLYSFINCTLFPFKTDNVAYHVYGIGVMESCLCWRRTATHSPTYALYVNLENLLILFF